ncbi:flavodoxin family protein [Dehalococcoides mccartyi]|jgi:multimeric flavodoxin WrbA|uniref:flavodoxin family protein n=1 Tax=Dehalococcoides mccartyi TaxID=61435 RepID=UPI0003C8AD9D|nr:flavodoxin family protein [Dehalococcoides mccartyi]AHB13926.1 NADPH-dependent FMN reductase [Dehalococcoides mccartyi GY50]
MNTKLKIVLISGSPRKGNTEYILGNLDKLLKKEGADTSCILLRKYNICACTGCLACETGLQNQRGNCKQKDDMPELLEQLKQADILVLGTPVYFEMLSGLMKNFIDRTCPVWPSLQGKKMGGVAVAEEGIGQALLNLKQYADVCRMKYLGSLELLAKTPKEASHDSSLPEKIKDFADLLLQG